jgi:hypothetical protein
MILLAALSWYDEPVPFLTRCVESLSRSVDGLVAFDGPWNLWPRAEPQSDPEQTQAILEGWGSGLDLWVSRLDRPWPSQVAKRDAMMKHAVSIGADWILVIDGDEWVDRLDRPALDEALEGSGREVARVSLLDSRWDRGSPVRRLYRALPGLTVDIAHNGYAVDDADGRRWLHGDPAFVALERPVDVSAYALLRHEHRSRGVSRNADSVAYRWQRRYERAERWPGGLKPPQSLRRTRTLT